MEILINTKEKIVNLGLELIQTRGINGFSFADIAKVIDIKRQVFIIIFQVKPI